MKTVLPTRRSLSSSTKKMSASFLRLAYGSIFALLLLMSGGVFGQETIACPAGTVVSNTMTFNTANFTIVHSKATDGSFASYSPWRVYTNNTVTFTGGIGVQRITSIVVTATTDAYASAAVGGTQTVLTGTGSISASASTTTATFTVSGSDVKSIRIKPNAQSRWSSITINYESSCSAPTTTATAIGFSSSLPTSRTIQWTNGTTGTNRAVFVKAGTTGTPTVADNTTYTASTTFGSGTAAGAGWTCVYNGTGSSVNVTGLTASTDYRAMVVEYNCAAGSEKYFTTATSAVNIDNFTTPSAGSPLITVSTASVTDFGSTCVGTNSTAASYTVSGSNLAGNIVITAPTHFEIKTGAGSYGSSVTLVPSSGTVATTTIDVRFSPSSVGAKTGDISHVSSTATTKNVSVSGTGSGGTVAVTTVAASAITTTTASSGGTTISSDCSATITAKGVVWGTSVSPTVPSASSTSDGTGTSDYTSSITGLTQNTLYYYRAYATNSNSVTGYGTGSTFTSVSKAPTAASASTATTTGFTASWTAPATQGSEALTYTVKVYSNNTFTTQVGSDITLISGTSTVVTGLSSSTTYYYTVAAVNAGGTSAVAGYTTGITTLSGPCFSKNGPDFSASGDTYSGDADSGGSPTTTIRLAKSGGSGGSISTTTTGIAAGDVNVKFRAKAWTSGETEVTVTVDGVSQFVSTLSTSFSEISLTFTSVSANPVIEFSTVGSKRVHIGNVNVYCIVSCAAPTVALSGTPVTSIATTSVTLNGNVTAAGGFAINTRGFEYSTNSGMTGSTTKSTAATATGTYSENVTGLVANTVYFYRGYAVNDCSPNKTGYTATSSYPSFTTLANAPTVGTGSAAAATSFTASWTAPTGGAAAFTYEIQVDNDNTFGSIDFTASSIAGLSISATGLASSTTYYYRVRAVNAGGNSAWSSTSVGYATAAPDPVITYAVLQYPGTHSMLEGSTVTVYGRAYAATVTEAAGDSGLITAEVGYNTSNTNPNTWTNWVAATWNAQYGNNDEYNASIGTGLIPGTYYYAVRFKLGSGAYVYGGTAGNWSSTANNGVLTINSNIVDWGNYQSPTTGTATLGSSYNVYGKVYQAGVTNVGSPGAGITAEAGYSATNTNPNTWTNWVAATFNSDIGNDDEYTANVGTSFPSAGTYYMAFRYKRTGSTEYVYGGTAGIWSSDNATVTVVTPQEINIKQGATNIASAGTHGFGNQVSSTSSSAVTFTVENTGGVALSVGLLSISGTNADQFSITQPLSSSVAASGNTTFTVTFSPTSLGAKTAQLSLVNNDGDENPYTINLTGTGTASAASDIVTDATFTYATNIDYKNYITADITAANSVELGRFTIRDGGATTDADNLGSTLSALGITVGNVANLQRLAIYDGSTEIAEVAASGTTNFTGLTLSAADNATKTFTIRGSFNTTVTDNQRITLTIASATASASGSTFGAISATTSATGTNNVLVVTADRLTFTTQPVTTTANTAMATVVVAATDINANKDEDKTGSVAITSTGTLTGSPVTVALSSGAASFTTLTHTVAGTGLTLSATLTGLTGATSSSFDITTFSTNDYKTISGTGLSWGNANHWQRWGGSSWNAAGADDIPSATRNIYIYGSMSTSGSRTADKIVIEDGGVLTVSSSSTATTKTLVKTGGKLQLDATFTNSGDLEVEDAGEVVINYTASGTSTLWNGSENFHPNSNLIIQKWNAGAGTPELLTSTNITTKTYNSYTAAFGNITYDFNTNPGGDIEIIASGVSLNLAHGNLLFLRSPTVSGAARRINVGATGTITSGIGGNFIIDDLYTATDQVRLKTSGTMVFTVKGNVQIDAATFLVFPTSTSGSSCTLNVDGNLVVTPSGVINFNTTATSNGTTILNLKGDLNGQGSGLLQNGNTTKNVDLNFVGTLQTIDIASTSSFENRCINFNIKSGSIVKLANRDFELGTNSKLNVENGGTLDFDFAAETPLKVLISGGQTGTVFDAQEGSTIRITSPDGVRIVADGAFGNVQTATRTFGVANYHYVGNANQITGSALPSTVASILVKNSTATNEVTLTNAITANTKLQVEIGILNLNEKTTAGGTSSTIEINAPGTLKIVGTNTYPDGFSTHTIDNDGTVHYAGTNQNIAAIPSPWMYGKLKVSGTGTKLLNTTDVQVGNTLEVTASVLSIGTGKTLTVTNAVTTINDGISIADGGSLVQITDENVNVGKIAVTRITKPMNKYDYTYWSSPVAGNTLHDLSPDTHVNRYYSYNPDAVAPALNWTAITGGAATMIAGKGYIIRAPNDYSATTYTAYTGSFNGVPNNGTVSIGVSGSATEDKYNLLGNPYPSAISAADFVAANVGGTNDVLDGTLYFWSHNSPFLSSPTFTYSTGDYASWNGSGGTATSNAGDGNSTAPDGYIAAGQGFFVKGSDDGGTAVFKNTMREKGSNMNFYRPNAAQNASNVNAATSETTTPEKHRVWLNLHGGTNGFSQALVGYIANATNGYDKLYDGKTFGGNLVTFYSINNANNLVIQGRALPFVDTDEVPMGYKSTITGNLTISIDHKDGALENQAIYIKDNVLDIVHDLTVSNYVFATVPGTFDNRFVLRYLPAVDLANPTFNEQISNVTIRKNQATLHVNFPYDTIDEVLVYDIMGRLVFEKKDCNSTTFEASNIINSDQTLIVKVKLSNGGVVTKKVM